MKEKSYLLTLSDIQSGKELIRIELHISGVQNTTMQKTNNYITKTDLVKRAKLEIFQKYKIENPTERQVSKYILYGRL